MTIVKAVLLGTLIFVCLVPSSGCVKMCSKFDYLAEYNSLWWKENDQPLDLVQVASNRFRVNRRTICADNQSLDHVPDQLTRYPDTEYVSLGGNRIELTSEDLAILEQLPALRYLRLGANAIQKADLSGLPEVRVLDIRANPLGEGVTEPAFPGTPWYLHLGATGISSIPPSILSLRELRHLDVSFNPIRALPQGLHSLKRLKLLYGIQCCLGELPDDSLPESLTELNLAANSFREVPRAVLRLRRLENLTLSMCRIRSIPSGMRKMKSLRWVTLHSNQIAELPAWISEMPNLIVFDASRNPITNVPPALIPLVREGVLLVDYDVGAVSSEEDD